MKKIVVEPIFDVGDILEDKTSHLLYQVIGFVNPCYVVSPRNPDGTMPPYGIVTIPFDLQDNFAVKARGVCETTQFPQEYTKVDYTKINIKQKDFGEIDNLSNLEQNGKNCKPANFTKSSKDLQELTEFEKAVQSVLYTEITNALNNDPYVITADKIKQASKMLLDKARKYYNEKSIDDMLQWGLLD